MALSGINLFIKNTFSILIIFVRVKKIKDFHYFIVQLSENKHQSKEIFIKKFCFGIL